MIQLNKWKPANLVGQVSVGLRFGETELVYLCISRVSIEDIREELARTSYSCNYETMDIVAINDEKL